MSVPTRLNIAALVLVLAFLFSACGSGKEGPPPVPDADQQSRVVIDTKAPVYWLGARYKGLDVSSVADDRDRFGFTYGEWTCDPGSGCSANGSVHTRNRLAALGDSSLREERIAHSGDCWQPVGHAVAFLYGCDEDAFPQEMEVLTGDLAVYVTSLYLRDQELPALTAARDLKALNDHAPWPLSRPERLSCAEFKFFPSPYRNSMPRHLRPSKKCRTGSD